MASEEIIQALRQCAKRDCSSCGMCPIFQDRECVEHLAAAAASLIERLTAENAALRKEIEWKDMVIALAQRKTGLTPKEVTALGELFDYALKESKTLTEQLTLLKHVRKLAEADKDGRVVVLLCKVGDTVFARLDNKSKYVCERKVKQIVVGNIGVVTFAPIGAPERRYDVSLRGSDKTVFLTREEADYLLAEMKGKKDD